MAKMFTTKEPLVTNDDGQTILGESVKIEGTFTSAGNITIHGAIVGTLKTTSDLMIKDTARIEANVEANNITLSGEIHGNVTCHGQLQILGTGKIFGDVITGTISVETGAMINGRCTTGETNHSSTPPTDPNR